MREISVTFPLILLSFVRGLHLQPDMVSLGGNADNLDVIFTVPVSFASS